MSYWCDKNRFSGRFINTVHDNDNIYITYLYIYAQWRKNGDKLENNLRSGANYNN